MSHILMVNKLAAAESENKRLQQQVDALQAELQGTVCCKRCRGIAMNGSHEIWCPVYLTALPLQQQVTRLTAALRTIQDATQGIPIYRTIYRLTTEALSSPAPEVKVHVGGGQ